MTSVLRLRSLIEAARQDRVLRQKQRWDRAFAPRRSDENAADPRRTAWRAYFDAIEDGDALGKATAALAKRSHGDV